MKRGSDAELVGTGPNERESTLLRLLASAKRMEREFGRGEPDLSALVRKVEDVIRGRSDMPLSELEHEITTWSMYLEG